MKIKSCIIWTNGMVFSFDEKGEHVQECEGFILDIAEKLKNNCDENTKWEFGKWVEWIEDARMKWYWEKRKRDNIEAKEDEDIVQANK